MGLKGGVKQNFANAISKCRGNYIFLADQDDIWKENKVERVLQEFNKDEKITLVIHDAEVFNSDNKEVILDSFFDFRHSKNGIIKNIWKNSYIGCCIAFKSSLKKYILPIPNDIEMHDQWIGIINELKCGSSVFLKENLIRYRRHVDTLFCE